MQNPDGCLVKVYNVKNVTEMGLLFLADRNIALFGFARVNVLTSQSWSDSMPLLTLEIVRLSLKKSIEVVDIRPLRNGVYSYQSCPRLIKTVKQDVAIVCGSSLSSSSYLGNLRVMDERTNLNAH